MSDTEVKSFLTALQSFAASVTSKTTAVTHGEPEDQLRAPFESLFADLGQVIGRPMVCTGETLLADRLGKPDYAIHASEVLTGYAELKAPRTGVAASRFTGRNRQQWKRFSAIPNLLYTDGNDWAVYRSGEMVGKIVRLDGDVAADGAAAASIDNARALFGLLTEFLSWSPLIPTTRNGEIDLKGLAVLLAPLCRMLRDDVNEALADANSPLVQIAKDWRQLLFPEATDEQFSDAYAQTVTFALLLARSEGAEPLTLETAETQLAGEHTLLSRALQVLTDPRAQEEISASLNILVRVVGAVPVQALTGPRDPWLYFYEDFLAEYDPELRKNIGAYYTPVEVVRAQVRLIDDLLVNRLGKPLGFADHDVITLDPAVGTGTYLLGVIDHALSKVAAQEGAGAVPGQATSLARNIYGFELLVGPFAVSELRISRALLDRGAKLPADGTHVYLTDTLESPNTPPPTLPFYLKPIAEQHTRALRVKAEVPVIVCLGNPPYDRHAAADESNKAQTGGWVRWGDDEDSDDAIFSAFVEPAAIAGHGVHLKWLYNLYVYFWRWALWKVFERERDDAPGIVTFISAASYLFGDAFCGMREYMRRECDQIWIVDLGGEGRGGRKDENVFAIQTPVAIAVAARFGPPNRDRPADVQYAAINGTRAEKLTALEEIECFDSLTWEQCPTGWQSSFLPSGEGTYFDWPLIRDLFPWQHSGCQLFRTWPIAPTIGALQQRWHALLATDDRATAFKESRDRSIAKSCKPLLEKEERATPIEKLAEEAPLPRVSRYAYRSFDRQYVIADSRVGDVMKPILWEVAGDAANSKQLFLTSQLWQVIGRGAALTCSVFVPDFHHFKGSYGGKDVIPLYRDAACEEPNIAPGLLEKLTEAYSRDVSAEDFAAYVYGLLAHPGFTQRYAEELSTRELRVPITTSGELFEQVRAVGARLLWLHTYAQRLVPTGQTPGQVPQGTARCQAPIPGDADGYPERFSYDDATETLHVGDGAFAPVAAEVYNFEVSGLKVVQSWLGYRMKKPKGRKSSPLDEINPTAWTADLTTELLELLWVLEATIVEYPRQAELLAAVVDSAIRQAEPTTDTPTQQP